ncbi:phosphoserine phosphatase SerB [Glaesserella parasuis]|nr:phosphoserine phosphatase SerB [Glaesserella parasuis]
MSHIFFIYSKQLTAEQIAHFTHISSTIFVKQVEYLDYHVAFFRGDLTDSLREKAQTIQADFSRLDILPCIKREGLLLMDMDSTAIKIECIDEIAKLAGKGEIVSSITARAMRGELDFEESLRQRVAALENAPESILQQVREQLPLMDGFELLVKSLKQYGWKIAIASGGFDYFADYLRQSFDLDYSVSNRLEVIDGKLTGQILGKVVDAQCKADTLMALAHKFGIPQVQWIAVGDGANDLLMLKHASLGVALHAKPKVQEQSAFVVNFGDLTALLLLLKAKELFDSP